MISDLLLKRESEKSPVIKIAESANRNGRGGHLVFLFLLKYNTNLPTGTLHVPTKFGYDISFTS
jgi:hypothetical protein